MRLGKALKTVQELSWVWEAPLEFESLQGLVSTFQVERTPGAKARVTGCMRFESIFGLLLWGVAMQGNLVTLSSASQAVRMGPLWSLSWEGPRRQQGVKQVCWSRRAGGAGGG